MRRWAQPLALCKPKQRVVPAGKLRYKRADWSALNNMFLTYLPKLDSVTDISLAWSEWADAFWVCVNKCIPRSTCPGRYSHPWISKNITALIHKRDRLYKKWVLSKLDSDHVKFLSLRNTIKHKFKTAREQYLWELGRGPGGNTAMFKYINFQRKCSPASSVFKVRGVVVSEPDVIAEEFGKSFSK